MYDESIKLLEMPQIDAISVCVYAEDEGLFELGERIHARFQEAYMNGYNWDALIRFYVTRQDPALMAEIDSDPEAGLCSVYTSFSPESLEKMKRVESYVRAMVADEAALMEFIEAHRNEIEWD